MYIHSSRRMRIFRLLCCLVYFSSYMTRINYSASILAVMEDLQFTRADAGLAVTGSFFTYGLGQFFSGLLGDRFPPRYLILIGLCGAAGCNLLLPAFTSHYLIAAIWCVCGFCHSLLWPPLVRIMADNLDGETYLKTCVEVSAASSVATILTYLTVPLCLRFADWKAAFYLPAMLTFAVAAVWITALPRLGLHQSQTDRQKTSPRQPAAPLFPLLIHSGVWLLLPAIAFHGLLRDGITTWLPACVADLGGLDTSSSILSAVILPVFSICSVWLAARLNRIIAGETSGAALLFALGAAASFAMLACLNTHPLMLVLLMALITGCMHGVNLMLISRMPACFSRHGCVSGMSGLLNACTYLGSALSTYGVAALSDHFGWEPTILLWGIIAAAGSLLCIAAHRKWMSFRQT